MLCVELVCFDFGMFCWFVWMSCVWITLVSTDFGLFGVDVMWFELMCVDSKLFMCYLRLVYVFELHLRWFVLDSSDLRMAWVQPTSDLGLTWVGPGSCLIFVLHLSIFRPRFFEDIFCLHFSISRPWSFEDVFCLHFSFFRPRFVQWRMLFTFLGFPISIVFVSAWGNVCGFVWIRFVRMLFVLNCLILFDWICVDWIGPGSTCVELFWIAWFVLSWLLNCLVELLGFVIFVFTLFDNFDLFGLYSFGFNLCWLALN